MLTIINNINIVKWSTYFKFYFDWIKVFETVYMLAFVYYKNTSLFFWAIVAKVPTYLYNFYFLNL